MAGASDPIPALEMSRPPGSEEESPLAPSLLQVRAVSPLFCYQLDLHTMESIPPTPFFGFSADPIWDFPAYLFFELVFAGGEDSAS